MNVWLTNSHRLVCLSAVEHTLRQHVSWINSLWCDEDFRLKAEGCKITTFHSSLLWRFTLRGQQLRRSVWAGDAVLSINGDRKTWSYYSATQWRPYSAVHIPSAAVSNIWSPGEWHRGSDQDKGLTAGHPFSNSMHSFKGAVQMLWHVATEDLSSCNK